MARHPRVARRYLRRTLCGVLLMLLTGGVMAADGRGGGNVSLPGTRQWTMHSPETGGDYLIQVAVPDGPAPAAGYPVLYVLDGNTRFPLLLAARETLTRHDPAASPEPLLIVGVGYTDTERFAFDRRSRDYTPPVQGSPDRPAQERPHGGAPRFLDFIETHLKPAIHERFAVDTGRETLLGHSYGGLFAVYTLLTRPAAFDRYAAISPSLWWYPAGGPAVAGNGVSAGGAQAPAVLLGVGAREQTPGPSAQGTRRAARVRERAMVDRTRDMAAALRAAHPDWGVDLRVFAGEDHGSVMWPAARAALTLALRP